MQIGVSLRKDSSVSENSFSVSAERDRNSGQSNDLPTDLDIECGGNGPSKTGNGLLGIGSIGNVNEFDEFEQESGHKVCTINYFHNLGILFRRHAHNPCK